MANDREQHCRDLAARLHVLEQENAMLAERAEDLELLGLMGEQLNSLTEPKTILALVLERLVILKGLTAAACCVTMADGSLEVLSLYLLHTANQPALPFVLADALPSVDSGDPLLLDAGQAAKVGFSLPWDAGQPAGGAMLLLPFPLPGREEKAFLLLQDRESATDRLRFLLPTVARVADMCQARLANLELMEQLRTLNSTLEQQVCQRTEKLRESREKYRCLLDLANDAILLADAESGLILEANQAAGRLLGRPAVELIGMHQTKLHPPAEQKRYAEIFRRHVASGAAISETLYVQHQDGQRIPVQISARTFTLGGRQMLQGIFRDMREQQRHEERLRQAQKMEAIGTLAGGIAHDFNNILSPIIGFTELSLDVTTDATVQNYLAEVLRAGQRARDLVAQILAFSRQKPRRRVPLLLQPLIKETVKFLRASIPTTIAITTDIDGDCPPVLADPVQVQQIVMNLATNGYQAMGEQGTLTITLQRVEINAGHPVAGAVQPGEYTLLAVTDSGAGIPSQVMDRIFDPYFTTKEEGRGTGLGLAVVRGIVHGYGGTVTVESQEGRGTTFRVYLPAVRYQTVAEGGPSTGKLVGGSERILCVEDEAALRTMLATMLERLGYTVLTAADGRQALAVLETEGVDLLLTDQTMPGLSGIELARQAMAGSPELPVILCTGYSSAVTENEARQQGIAAFCMKPVTLEQLAATVRRVLDNRP